MELWDTDKDGAISFEEFIASAKDFKEWKDLGDDNPDYLDEYKPELIEDAEEDFDKLFD